jgi:hypothetical protein
VLCSAQACGLSIPMGLGAMLWSGNIGVACKAAPSAMVLVDDGIPCISKFVWGRMMDLGIMLLFRLLSKELVDIVA